MGLWVLMFPSIGHSDTLLLEILFLKAKQRISMGGGRA